MQRRRPGLGFAASATTAGRVPGVPNLLGRLTASARAATPRTGKRSRRRLPAAIAKLEHCAAQRRPRFSGEEGGKGSADLGASRALVGGGGVCCSTKASSPRHVFNVR